ncbi:unnamed protein product [marine sediment metagenome]|uniref:Peptidase M15C domain-containing protein n=1 Tax=marine sediment metagenome TaxID=412755 RepID=X0VNU3_9ZZZZ
MKFKFGRKSTKNYESLNSNLQRVAVRALSYGIMDFSLDCTHRNKGEQNRFYQIGRSKVMWPDSKHNALPAEAMDCVPYVGGKSSWNKLYCCVLAGLILAAAKEEGVKVRWGGDWGMNGEPITDQDFNDLAHYEEVK